MTQPAFWSGERSGSWCHHWYKKRRGENLQSLGAPELSYLVGGWLCHASSLWAPSAKWEQDYFPTDLTGVVGETKGRINGRVLCYPESIAHAVYFEDTIRTWKPQSQPAGVPRNRASYFPSSVGWLLAWLAGSYTVQQGQSRCSQNEPCVVFSPKRWAVGG